MVSFSFLKYIYTYVSVKFQYQTLKDTLKHIDNNFVMFTGEKKVSKMFRLLFSFCCFFETKSHCLPDCSAVARSRHTAASTFQTQAILLPQPPEWLGPQIGIHINSIHCSWLIFHLSLFLLNNVYPPSLFFPPLGYSVEEIRLHVL